MITFDNYKEFEKKPMQFLEIINSSEPQRVFIRFELKSD